MARNQSPTVSVIIPFYNRKELLLQSLDSVDRARKHSEYVIEVVVVNDGSEEDKSDDFLNRFPLTTYIKQTNRGAPAARNKGLLSSKGKYVLYLDSDDLIEKDFFDPKIRCLEENKDISGAYGPFDYFSSAGVFREEDIIPRHSPYPVIEKGDFLSHLERVLTGWYIPCNGILWRKGILEAAGGQDESLLINQDVDLLFRILIGGNKIQGVRSGRALVRSHDGERVGIIGIDPEKLEHVLRLRKKFHDELVHHKLDTPLNREVLARNCFGYWVKYRKRFPGLANEFLSLSDDLFPGLNVKGNRYFEWLGKMAGKENAVRIKDKIYALKNKFKSAFF